MNEQIMTSKEGSFARFTIESRVPEILKGLRENNPFTPSTGLKLKELQDSIPNGRLLPLNPDYPFSSPINQVLEEHPDYNWLNAPFLFVENYLYHCIADSCGYFENGFDYFLYKKEADIRRNLDKVAGYLHDIESVDTFPEICLLNLMGNKADLSQSDSYYSAQATSQLLIDHRDNASEKIAACKQVDIVLDNAGEELFFDLLLVQWLFKKGGVQQIRLHFKSMPYFVSDALISDYRLLLNLLSERDDTLWFVTEMNNYEKKGKLILESDPFWSSGQLYSSLSGNLYSHLIHSDLIIFKGDLNYRRLVGDHYWPYEKETASLINYFKTDVLISRILKCEVMAGVAPEMIPHRETTDWMYSGNYGQIEFVEAK
ncbi:MAG: protein-glutamate O-methyltransferase family protein [Spirochaetales bacterium]|nr:protein-glutamate O-methyltransferase family protein [Spirochaetales bacterium]